MKRLGLLLVFVAACKGPEREARMEPPPAANPVTVVPLPPPVGEEVAVDYRTQTDGQALIEVAAPPGARVDIREGQALVGRDTAPMAVKAEADHLCMIGARLPSGAVREAKVQARAGQVASLRFVDVPQGPQAMSREAFKGFLQALDEEPGDQGKLNLLRSAAAKQWFTSAMAGVLIDHIVYRENKLAAVPILKDRILDRENAFWLYQHFTYREDKAKVQEILEKAATLELRHFEDADFYDKMQNARREASIRPLSMALETASLLQQLLILTSYAVLLARLSPWSVLLIVAASVPSFIAEARFSGESFRLNTWRAPEGRRQNYLEWILTRDSHVKEVKLFDLAPLVLRRYRALFEKFYAEDRSP